MSQETLELLKQIFEVCIIPLLGILTTYLIKFINKKAAEISAVTDSEILQKYIAMVQNTITTCVIATNQTYVDALKEKGEFGPEAQAEAFERTKTAVLAILSEEAKVYIGNVFGDAEQFINQLIENAVADNKAPKSIKCE